MNLNIVCLLGILISSSVALAHGSLEWPKSRVKHIYDAMNQTPRPVWAAQAIALDGEQSYYTWNQMSRNFPSAIQGNPQAYYDQIPDGQLASAGNLPATAQLPSHPGLSFSGLDTVSPSWLWPATPVSAGPREFTFYATATHDPSFFKVWISKQGYNPQTELRWQDLESLGQPAHTRTGNNYYFTVNLPERTGRAVVYVAGNEWTLWAKYSTRCPMLIMAAAHRPAILSWDLPAPQRMCPKMLERQVFPWR